MPKASKFSKPHEHLDRQLRHFGELPTFTESDMENLQDCNGRGGTEYGETREPPAETVAKVEAMKELYRRKYEAAFVRVDEPVETPVVPSMVWCGVE